MMDWKQWAEDKLNKSLNEPQWLTQARTAAFKQFMTLGAPGRKQELWKYANTKRLQSEVELEATVKSVATDELTLVIGSNHYQIYGELSEGLNIESFAELSSDPGKNIIADTDRSFAQLNQAVMTQGLKISLKANTQARLKVLYQQTKPDWNVFRLHFELAQNSSLQLHEVYQPEVTINQVNQFHLGANSRLKIQSQRALKNTAKLLNNQSFFCDKGVVVEHMIQNNQAHFLHEIIDVHFNQENSRYQASVANVSANNSQICENIHVYHDVPNCQSRIIERSLADDKSQVTVNAKAIVEKAADGSDISQSLKNVLLSDDARINSKPELEINTDEVVAAHGSTIGELDETALNYLRSRGIDKKQAKKMLVESFLQDANLFQVEDFLESLSY